MCAVQGKLPGQGGFGMRFAHKPSDLDVYGGKPLGQCRGWRPGGWGDCGYGYATDDIFFLEVCIYSWICENSADLFRLRSTCTRSDELFRCAVSETRVRELRSIFERRA